MAIRIFLDTNSIIDLLNEDLKVIEEVNTADEIMISVINELEFKSFSNLSLNDKNLFDAFASIVTVLDLKASDIVLKNKIIEIRSIYKIKLPDAIIAATAIINNAKLITGDKGFRKVKELQLKLILKRN
jgi:predicted nucleic acid-binding protein